MAGTGKKWLIGCGLGCGIPLLLVIVLTIGGGVVMMKPYTKAVDAQKALTTTYGERGDFVPSADGLTPARLEQFIAVRRALMPLCADFLAIGEKFQQMEKLDQGGEEPSKGEVVEAVGGMMGAVFGIAGNIGRFTLLRNEALLSEEMGLGEYIWIYTLVYNSWLGYAPGTGFEGDQAEGYTAGEQKLIRQLMSNHAGALAAAGRAEAAAAWKAEADHLERREGSGVPWTDHELPAALALALEPYRADLDDLYCAPTSAFEFNQVRKKGLTIIAD